jgi:hypothetical protein
MTRTPISPDAGPPVPEDVPELLLALGGDDGLLRKQARRRLVRLGDAAVPGLVDALEAASDRMRLEAAEALLYVGSPRAAPALVEALDDREFGVRWLAAEALIALKCGGIVPVLEGLTRRAGSLWFRQSAHHVLHDHYCDAWRESLGPVLDALEDHGAAGETAAVAADAALSRIQGEA